MMLEVGLGLLIMGGVWSRLEVGVWLLLEDGSDAELSESGRSSSSSVKNISSESSGIIGNIYLKFYPFNKNDLVARYI